MFGYVRPFEPDLRVREYEMYRSLYCGLCRSMGKHTGLLSRFTLSYDAVFLAAVRIALGDERVCPKLKPCLAHPLKKRSCCLDNGSLRYASAVSALLFYYKACDNVEDEKGIKRLFYKALMPFAGGIKNKALLLYDFPQREIEKALSDLKKLEDACSPSLDSAADCFGQLLGVLFSYGLEGNSRTIAFAVGMSLGRYIYVVDAVDDVEEDKKSGGYNPVILSGINREELKVATRLELKKLSSAVELIDFSYNREIGEIIRNIVYEGLLKISDDVFEGKYKKGKK